jgi:hypothetical protein
MNRPWSVAIILVLTILLVGAGVVMNIQVRALEQQGYINMDPELQFRALSPVHTFFLVLSGALIVAAAIFLFMLNRWARVLYLGAIVAQLADLAYFWAMTNVVSLELLIFVLLGLLLYSQHLYRQGFLR